MHCTFNNQNMHVANMGSQKILYKGGGEIIYKRNTMSEIRNRTTKYLQRRKKQTNKQIPYSFERSNDNSIAQESFKGDPIDQ